MKRKRILSLMLCFALVFTTVFAGTGSAFAGEKVATKAAVKASVRGTESVEAYTPLNYNQVDWEDPDMYSENVAVFPEQPTSVTADQAVTVKKKGHYLFMVTAIATTSGTATAYIMNDEGEAVCQESLPMYYDSSLGVYTATSTIEVPLEQTGNYVVYVAPPANFGEQLMMCELLVTYLPQSTKTAPLSILNAGEKMYDNPSGGYSWFKVKTDGTRNLTIQFSAEGTFSVRLYKSNKSTVLGGGTVSVGSGKKYTTYYAVPAGTYYVRVYKKESVTPYYGIKMSTGKVTEKSGSTKAKAVAVGKNVLKKGTLLATETASTSVDWYKVTLSKNQTFWMHLAFKTGGISNGGVKISVYKKGSTNPILTKKFSNGAYSQDWKIYNTGNGGKLKPGTYYFKVQKYNYASGYYSLKWNNVE